MTDSFSQAFDDLHLLKHPFYQAWMEGRLPMSVLRDYAVQYYHHVDRFPRYLSAIHSLCERNDHRKKILENLNEEEGTAYGVSHPELWQQFAEGLGVPKAEVLSDKAGPAIRNVAETFFRYSRSSFHEGLGALFAYESQVPEVATSKLEGLKTRYGIEEPRTLSFFEVHQRADEEHRSVILEMLESLTEAEKDQARAAARASAQALWDFLSEMYQEREACA